MICISIMVDCVGGSGRYSTVCPANEAARGGACEKTFFAANPRSTDMYDIISRFSESIPKKSAGLPET